MRNNFQPFSLRPCLPSTFPDALWTLPCEFIQRNEVTERGREREKPPAQHWIPKTLLHVLLWLLQTQSHSNSPPSAGNKRAGSFRPEMISVHAVGGAIMLNTPLIRVLTHKNEKMAVNTS